jgi:hypothetical protein
MAMDASNIYWTENLNGGVFQLAKGGGGIVTIKAADGTNASAWAVAVDSNSGGNSVYWSDRANGRIGANTIGGTGVIHYYASPNGTGAGTYGIAAGVESGTIYVYGADFSTGGLWYARPSNGAIFSFGAASGPTGLYHPPNGVWFLSVLYNSGTVLYNGASMGTGTNNDARYVTSDGTTAFWTASDGNQVWYLPLTARNTTPLSISTVESQPWGITTDGVNSVYWVNKTNGTIRHATFSGSWNVVTLATGNNPTDIRVDGSAIYWTDNGSGQVMRVNK